MYTTGYKSTVLKDLNSSTINSTTWEIPGFGQFPVAHVSSLVAYRYLPGINFSADYSIPASTAANQTITLKVHVQSNRYESEFAKDFMRTGRHIMLVATSTASGQDFVPLIINNWNLVSQRAADRDDYSITLNANGANTLKITGLKFSIDVNAVEYKIHGQASFSDFSILTPNNKVIALDPVGSGKFVEESVKMSTFVNTDPYAKSHNGSDSAILDTNYTVFDITIPSIHAGYSPHELMGIQVANQNISTHLTKFTVYVPDDAVNGSIEMQNWINAINP